MDTVTQKVTTRLVNLHDLHDRDLLDTDAGSARNLLDHNRLLESTNLSIRDSHSNKMQMHLTRAPIV